MRIEKAAAEDLEQILDLQKLAYLSEAEIYNDFTIPPLVQTLDQVSAEFEISIFLKAVIDGKIVGSVRAGKQGTACHIGKLVVHPDYRRRGIGTSLMNEVETHFTEIDRYELFTGHLSENNLRLYERLGYKRFKEQTVNDRLTMVFLEKVHGLE